jgi:hypothetical protein
VADTGIGIPENQQGIIFESFRQLDGQSTRKDGGTGLGLAISQRLVEMMNRQISVKSTISKGSIFEIILRDVEVYSSALLETPETSFDLKKLSFEKGQVSINLSPENLARVPALIETLEKEILPIIKNINGVIEIDVIENLAHKIVKLGADYQVPGLVNYGERLRELSPIFDITNINKALKAFP